MIDQLISELVAYGLQNGLIEDADKVYLLKVYKKGPLHFCEMVLRKNVQFSQNSPFSIYTWYGCSKYSA